MKYQVPNTDEHEDELEIHKVRVIKATTRAVIAILMIAGWLAILGLAAAEAFISGHRTDLHMILLLATHPVSVAIGWYLGHKA